MRLCTSLFAAWLLFSTMLFAQQPAEPETATKPDPAAKKEKRLAAQASKESADKPSKAKSEGSDLAAIRAASQTFLEAFNKGNADAVAVHWTDDGDYTDDSGKTFSGRAAIKNEYKRLFAEHKGAKLRIVIDSLRLLSADAAIEDGRAMLDPPPQGPPCLSKYTVVHVKVDGKWLMSTVRETSVEVASGYRNVEDLEWLIGTWSAEAHGAKTEAVCRWTANKSFVERSFTLTRADGTTTSGVQLIGFNPAAGHMQSWMFSSDGGHAIGIWSPRENGWSADVHGTSGDGTPTSAVNLLTRIDDNACIWQSVQRTLGETSLPDTEEVVLKRRVSQP